MVQQTITSAESHTSVLQELLLALLGYPGDIFIEQPKTHGLRPQFAEPWSCDLHLGADVDWLNCADRCKLSFDGLSSLSTVQEGHEVFWHL